MYMNDWKLELFSGLSRAGSMEDVIDTAAAAIRHQGFDYCSWKAMPPHAPTGMLLEVASADEEIYGRILSNPSHASVAPSQLWAGIAENEVRSNAPRLVESFSDHHSCSSWLYPACDSRTGAYSIFYANSSTALSEEQLQQVSPDMQWIAAAVHASMFYLPVRLSIPLTLREKSVLSLIEEGMDLEEIATQLRLTEPTTFFHLESAEYKLQTPDPLQAAAKARFFGLLN